MGENGCCGGGHSHEQEAQESHGHSHAGANGNGHGASPQTVVAPTQAPSRFSGQIAISDMAAAKLKDLIIAEKKDPAQYGLRLGIQGGGCSGMTYFMDFDTIRDDDKVFTHPAAGVKVLIDAKSLLYVSGSVLDYNEGLMGAGFSIKNPNVKSSCGCGNSFST